MATGTAYQPGGVAAPSDVPFAGAAEWSRMTGVAPESPLVGGGYGLPGAGINVDGSRSRIVTTGASMPDMQGPGVELLDDWRDVFNFRGSPAPWILLLLLTMLGLMQLRVNARAGRAKGSLALG